MRLPDLRILTGEQNGEAQDIQSIDSVAIYGVTVDGAIDIEVSPDDGVTWYSLVTAVAAGARVVVNDLLATDIRLVSDAVGGETADRAFPMHGADKKIA